MSNHIPYYVLSFQPADASPGLHALRVAMKGHRQVVTRFRRLIVRALAVESRCPVFLWANSWLFVPGKLDLHCFANVRQNYSLTGSVFGFCPWIVAKYSRTLAASGVLGSIFT